MVITLRLDSLEIYAFHELIRKIRKNHDISVTVRDFAKRWCLSIRDTYDSRKAYFLLFRGQDCDILNYMMEYITEEHDLYQDEQSMVDDILTIYKRYKR